jgi:hypothetical protein
MTPADLEQVFIYLDDLRNSGSTNMFGAVPHIATRFKEHSLSQLRRAWSLWTLSFDEEKSVKERVAIGLMKEFMNVG